MDSEGLDTELSSYYILFLDCFLFNIENSQSLTHSSLKSILMRCETRIFFSSSLNLLFTSFLPLVQTSTAQCAKMNHISSFFKKYLNGATSSTTIYDWSIGKENNLISILILAISL